MSGKKGKGSSKSSIHSAVQGGDMDAVKEFLAQDSTLVTTRNKDGWTPLHTAAYEGQLDILGLLISSGADVNATCNDGDTALHYASAQGEAEVILALAAANAKLLHSDNDGETALDVANGKKIKNLLQGLIEKAAVDEDAEGEEADDGES